MNIISQKIGKQTDKELQTILTQMPGYIYWLDLKNVFQGCNLQQAKSLGVSSVHDIIGKRIDYFISEEDIKQIIQNNQSVVKRQETLIFEEHFTSLDDTEKVFLSHKSPLFDRNNKVVGLLVNSLDISDYKLREKELFLEKHAARTIAYDSIDELIKIEEQMTGSSLSNRKSLIFHVENMLEYFKNIITLAPGHVYWKDGHGKYLGCNANMAKAVGLPIAKIIGKDDYDLAKQNNWPKGIAKRFLSEDLEVIRTGEPIFDIEEPPVKRIDGNVQSLLTNKVPLKNKLGETIGILGISIDITQRKKIEKALERANALKQQFIENMQHDLRTPATGLAGLLSQLVASEKDPKYKESLTLLHEAAEELLILIDSIVDFDRINYGEIPLLEQKFNLIDILTTIERLYQVGAKEKGLAFEIKLDPELPKVLIGDAFRLQRILMNLVDNAIKFTEKGLVEVLVNQAQTESAKQLALSFIVKDSGVGIPEDKQLLIYEKFTRLHPSNTGRYKGVGLGLSLVKKFVSELKGEIELISESEKGATFVVTLPFKEALFSDTTTPLYSPLASFHSKKEEVKKVFAQSKKKKIVEKSASEPTPQNKSEKASYTKYQVLLVEDSPIAQMLGRKLLTTDQAEVVVAGNGKEALDAVKEKNFDLILMDLGLPHGEDGRDVTRNIRKILADQTTHRVPIVALTAHTDQAGKQACLDAGMNAIYRKPLTEEKLREIRSLFLMNKEQPNTQTKETVKNEEFPLTGKVFDWELAIERAGGDEKSAKTLLPVVKQSLEEETPKLTQAFNEKNFEELRRVAHKLRGGCAYTGTPRLQQACSYLEEYIMSGKREAIEKLYQQLMNEVEAVQKAIASSK